MIDGLATKFVQNRWSVKSLIREIVLSDAYRRSSVQTPSMLKHDPRNRLFARQNVRRLESEAIMNTMAWLRHGQRFTDPQGRDAKLMAAPLFHQQFDGPTKDDLIDRRVASVSASQALFLMNSTSTASVLTSTHIRRLSGGEKVGLTESLNRIYQVVLQRLPSDKELAFAETFVERRRKQTDAVDPAGEFREFVSLLLCGNEIIYIE